MPEYYIPEVIDDLSSKNILTTELIDGTSLDRIENPDQETINKVLSSPSSCVKKCSCAFRTGQETFIILERFSFAFMAKAKRQTAGCCLS